MAEETEAQSKGKSLAQGHTASNPNCAAPKSTLFITTGHFTPLQSVPLHLPAVPVGSRDPVCPSSGLLSHFCSRGPPTSISRGPVPLPAEGHALQFCAVSVDHCDGPTGSTHVCTRLRDSCFLTQRKRPAWAWAREEAPGMLTTSSLPLEVLGAAEGLWLPAQALQAHRPLATGLDPRAPHMPPHSASRCPRTLPPISATLASSVLLCPPLFPTPCWLFVKTWAGNSSQEKDPVRGNLDLAAAHKRQRLGD